MRLIDITSETYANCTRSILLVNYGRNNIFEQQNIDEYAHYLFQNRIFAYRFSIITIPPNESFSKSLILRNNPQIKEEDTIDIISTTPNAILIGITYTGKTNRGVPVVRIITEEIPPAISDSAKNGLIRNFLDTLIAIERENLRLGIGRLSDIRYRNNDEPLSKDEISENESFIATDILADTVLPHDRAELSKLCIDEFFEIHLPLYPQIRIEMAPLPKSLYILLLLHPEGFILKNIHNYSNELIQIYCTISGRQNPSVIKKMFDSITNPTTNPLHKNLSIIRRAFLSKLRTDIAEQYIPTQGRYTPHRIPLESDKIELPKTFLHE